MGILRPVEGQALRLRGSRHRRALCQRRQLHRRPASDSPLAAQRQTLFLLHRDYPLDARQRQPRVCPPAAPLFDPRLLLPHRPGGTGCRDAPPQRHTHRQRERRLDLRRLHGTRAGARFGRENRAELLRRELHADRRAGFHLSPDGGPIGHPEDTGELRGQNQQRRGLYTHIIQRHRTAGRHRQPHLEILRLTRISAAGHSAAHRRPGYRRVDHRAALRTQRSIGVCLPRLHSPQLPEGSATLRRTGCLPLHQPPGQRLLSDRQHHRLDAGVGHHHASCTATSRDRL